MTYKKCLVIAAILMIPNFAAARTVVNVQNKDYEIEGETAQELRAQMNTKSPKFEKNERYDARTTWQIHWNYWYKNLSDGSCAISSVVTTTDVVFYMPHWDAPDVSDDTESDDDDEDESEEADAEEGADPDLVAHWNRYMNALQTHENGHKDIGLRIAQEIDSSIAGLPPQKNCDAMGALANKTGQAILTKHDQDDEVYDRKTKHGATQGALFP